MVRKKYGFLLTFCMMLFCAVTMLGCGGKIYTMTFRVDDKLHSAVGKYQEGDLILLPNDPVKEGYTFSRWSIDIPKNMPAKDLVAHARFTPNHYKITFHYAGATSGNSLIYLDVTYDAVVGELPTPEKEGYNFSGWYDSNNVKYTADTIYKNASDTALTAKYVANDVTVSFYGDDKYLTPITTKTVKFGSSLADIPNPPSKKGYTASWSVTDFSSITGNLKVHPVYTANTYTISYNADNGETLANKSVTFDSVIGELPEPTKTSQFFIGWYYNDVLFAPDKTYTVDSNITLTARYSSVRNIVNFYTDNTYTTLYATRYLPYGVNVVEDIPVCPTKIGHTAVWDKTLSGITGNLNVAAVYTPVEYVVTYMLGNTVFTTQTYYYDETITPPSAADTEDFVFVGWDLKYEKMPAENIVVQAKVIYFNLDMSNFESGEEIVIAKGGTFTLSGTTSATIKVVADDIVTLKLNGVKYTGDATFITVDGSNDLNIIAMLGTTSSIISNKGVGILSQGSVEIGGTGTIAINAKTYGIKANQLNIKEATLNIECYGQPIYVTTLNVNSGKTTALAYNTSNKYDYILDDSGEYVCVNNVYIVDNGNYTMEAHYSPIMPYGVVAQNVNVLGGTLGVNSTSDIAINATIVTLSNGTLNVDAGDTGIKASTLNISGGSLNVNHSVNYGVKATSIDVTGGAITVFSGGNGLQVDTANINNATIAIETEGNGIYAKTITITSVTCNIVTKGEFARDDFAGIFKYSNGKYSRFLNADLGKVSQKYKLVNTAKGIYAEDNITIYSCDMDITSVEAGIYSKDTMYIFGGEIKIATDCEAIVSELIVQIGYKDAPSLTPNFTINISASFVGIRAHYIECYDGVVMAYSYSDGILVEKSASNNNYLIVSNKANVYISSDEDGIDVTGDITLDGGSIIVYGGNTNTSLAIRYTKDFYYLQGELLNIGYKTLLPTKQLATTKLIGFALDSNASSKCTRNTYIMLYEKVEEAVPASDEQETTLFSKVLFLGVRNYIKGISIVYGSDVLEEGKTYSLRYAASSYSGGITPTHLPFICEGGEYNVDRCSNIDGKKIEEGVVAMLYGKHSVAAGEIEQTVTNGFKSFNTAITMADYTLTTIDKGGVVKNPVVEDPSLPEDEEE